MTSIVVIVVSFIGSRRRVVRAVWVLHGHRQQAQMMDGESCDIETLVGVKTRAHQHAHGICAFCRVTGIVRADARRDRAAAGACGWTL